MATPTLRLAQDRDADELLTHDPLALLVGMLLDQQFPMERAFAAPLLLAQLLKRVRALPGFGEQKSRIFVALLGKQLSVRPEGWREVAGPYGLEGTHRSVADVTDADSLARVRAFKQAAKRASAERK